MVIMAECLEWSSWLEGLSFLDMVRMASHGQYEETWSELLDIVILARHGHYSVTWSSWLAKVIIA